MKSFCSSFKTTVSYNLIKHLDSLIKIKLNIVFDIYIKKNMDDFLEKANKINF